MATYVENENESSTLSTLATGFYYYLIPRKKIFTAEYLGWVDTIQGLTFNPFIEEEDIPRVIECNFNTDKYGMPNGKIPKCYRIETDCIISKEIGNFELYTKRQDYNNLDPKLQMFPYRYFIVTDYMNSPLLLKPQMFSDNTVEVTIKATTAPLSIQSKYNIHAVGYKGDDVGNLEGINSNTSLMLPVTSSIYSQFISTSMASFAQGNINAMLENDLTLHQGLQNNAMNYNINNIRNNASALNTGIGILSTIVGNTVGGAMAGGPAGAGVGFATGVASGISSGLTAGINYAVNNKINNMQSQLTQNQLNDRAQLTEYEINTMTQARITDMLNTPNAIKTTGNDTIFNLRMSREKIDVIEYKPKDEVIYRLDDYFKKYGYRYNRYGKLSNHINSRKFFNFVKTNRCNIATAKVPLIHLQEIEEIFNRGTTIWHIDNGAEPLNYGLHQNDNVEVYK